MTVIKKNADLRDPGEKVKSSSEIVRRPMGISGWMGPGAVLLAIFLFWAPLLQAQDEAPNLWQLQFKERTAQVHGRFMGTELYLQLDELVGFLGGRLRRITEEDRILSVDIDTHHVLLNAGQALFNLDGQVFSMDHPVAVENGAWWVPVAWLERVVERLYGEALTVFPSVHQLWIGQVPGPRIRVRVQPEATLTRVVFESDRAVIYQVVRTSEGVEVHINSRFAVLEELPEGPAFPRLRGLRRDFRSGILKVILSFDHKKFRYRAYMLEMPPRFVIEIGEPFNLGGEAVVKPETGPGAPAPSVVPQRVPRSGEFDVVVLDPGHGGRETGTVGPTGVQEKDITLAVARRLKRMLEARLGVKVFLTREGDQDVDLDRRAAIANQYKADLFISIHANAALRGHAAGAETYYLSVDWMDRALKQRLKEAEPGAFQVRATDRSEVLELILWDLAQTAYIEESSRIARMIQETLNQELGISNRGVKQAPFRVLQGARMPAVLVEIGFLDNPREERLLKSPAYQERIARAIYRSIERYVETLRGRLQETVSEERTASSPPSR